MKRFTRSSPFSWNMSSKLHMATVLFSLCSSDNKQGFHELFKIPTQHWQLSQNNSQLVWKLADDYTKILRMMHYWHNTVNKSCIVSWCDSLPQYSSTCKIFHAPFMHDVCHLCTIWILIFSGLYTETKWQWNVGWPIFRFK